MKQTRKGALQEFLAIIEAVSAANTTTGQDQII